MPRCCCRSTSWGRWVYALGFNERSARLVGIPVDRMRIVRLQASGGLAGWPPLVSLAWLGSARPNIGQNLELTSLTAAMLGGIGIFGGRGGVLGVLAAVLLLVTLQTGLLQLNINSIWQVGIVGALLIAVLLLDPLPHAGDDTMTDIEPYHRRSRRSPRRPHRRDAVRSRRLSLHRDERPDAQAGPGERDCQLYLERRLEALGFATDLWDPDGPALYEKYKGRPGANKGRTFEGRPNLGGTLAGTGGGRSLMLTGHIDVVPPGAAEHWRQRSLRARGRRWLRARAAARST